MSEKWITACAAAQHMGYPNLIPETSGRTIRAELNCGLDGDAFRIVLGEKYGEYPISYGNIVVAVKNISKPVSFNGKRQIIINPGEVVYSDSIDIPVQNGDNIILWLYNNGKNTSVSACMLEQKHSHIGDFCGFDFEPQEFNIEILDEMELVENLTGFISVDVCVSDSAKQSAIVAFGDSITKMNFWVAPLREKIRYISKNTALLNCGIGGNRLLRDTHFPMAPHLQMFGKSGLTRIEWDLLAHKGIMAVILALGINDISQPGKGPTSPPKDERCSAEELIEGYKKFISLAHDAHIKVVGATITPFGGYFSYNENTESIRKRVNEWIINSGAFDMVIDFASAICLPENSSFLLSKYDSGDHLHPNSEGGAAMAEIINVEELLKLVNN